MGAVGQKAVVEVARKMGFYPKRVQIGDRMETRWSCTCASCGKERSWGWENNTSPRFMVQNINRAGWSHDSKRGPICDDCTKEASTRMSNKIDSINPKLQRKVFSLLDDHFDEDKRLYRAGWSDKKIAEAAETSEQFVATLRRGAYGELAEDPAVSALKGEIALLEQTAKQIEDELLNRMTELSQQITALHTRLDTYAMKRVA